MKFSDKRYGMVLIMIGVSLTAIADSLKGLGVVNWGNVFVAVSGIILTILGLAGLFKRR